jgi:diketogulonate reductase-like aldo/keto reductase
MDIPNKTLKNGFSLPVYGLGLWQVGGRWDADSSKDVAEIEAIHRAIENGITHFDMAESYGDGHAEELLGQAIKGVDRSNLILASKVSGSNQTYDGLLRSFEASLKRTGTDYLDLFMLHRYPDSGISIEDTMRAMTELVDTGVVKNIGVCNMTPNRFKEIQKHTPHKLVCNQVHYNVMVRETEKTGVLDYCQKNDTLLVAWGPVQKGMLPDVAIMSELAEKYQKTSTQIAINWLISQQNVVTISKTSSAAHLQENLGALDFEMETEDVELIRKDYPNQLPISDRVPLGYEADIAP